MQSIVVKVADSIHSQIDDRVSFKLQQVSVRAREAGVNQEFCDEILGYCQNSDSSSEDSDENEQHQQQELPPPPPLPTKPNTNNFAGRRPAPLKPQKPQKPALPEKPSPDNRMEADRRSTTGCLHKVLPDAPTTSQLKNRGPLPKPPLPNKPPI